MQKQNIIKNGVVHAKLRVDGLGNYSYEVFNCKGQSIGYVMAESDLVLNAFVKSVQLTMEDLIKLPALVSECQNELLNIINEQ